MDSTRLEDDTLGGSEPQRGQAITEVGGHDQCPVCLDLLEPSGAGEGTQPASSSSNGGATSSECHQSKQAVVELACGHRTHLACWLQCTFPLVKHKHSMDKFRQERLAQRCLHCREYHDAETLHQVHGIKRTLALDVDAVVAEAEEQVRLAYRQQRFWSSVPRLTAMASNDAEAAAPSVGISSLASRQGLPLSRGDLFQALAFPVFIRSTDHRVSTYVGAISRAYAWKRSKKQLMLTTLLRGHLQAHNLSTSGELKTLANRVLDHNLATVALFRRMNESGLLTLAEPLREILLQSIALRGGGNNGENGGGGRGEQMLNEQASQLVVDALATRFLRRYPDVQSVFDDAEEEEEEEDQRSPTRRGLLVLPVPGNAADDFADMMRNIMARIPLATPAGDANAAAVTTNTPMAMADGGNTPASGWGLAEIETLSAMGFRGRPELCMQALTSTGGDVGAAVGILLAMQEWA